MRVRYSSGDWSPWVSSGVPIITGSMRVTGMPGSGYTFSGGVWRTPPQPDLRDALEVLRELVHRWLVERRATLRLCRTAPRCYTVRNRQAGPLATVFVVER